MDTLIKRHPIGFFAAAMAIAVLFATFYITLSTDVVSSFRWLAGVPYSTVARALAPLLTYLQTTYFLVVNAVLA
jgi:hypothetical protein